MRGLAMLLLLPALACDTRADARVDWDGDTGPDRFAILSRDGSVKMALTDQVVYFALSDDKMDEVREEVGSQTEGGWVGDLVRGTVSEALAFRATYPVDEISAIRWTDGELEFEFEGERRDLDGFQVDNRPVTEAFAEEDARLFIREFEKLKAER